MARTPLRLALSIAVPFGLLVACGGGDDTAADDDDTTSSSSSAGGNTDAGGSTSSTSGNASSGGSGTTTSSSSGGSTTSSSSGESSTSSSSGAPPEPTCSDGVKNGDETDIDCGLACPNKCLGEQTCLGNSDCLDNVCTANVCVAALDTDNIKNGAETDVDCGGAQARPCSGHKHCLVGTDCVSEACGQDTYCVASYADGVKNQDETDIDCGGPTTTKKCAPGNACSVSGDCDGAKCLGGVCQTPAFDDNFQNLGETDVDCGGPNPSACGNGQKCAVQTDCVGNLFCNTTLAQPVCAQPVAGDGVTNGTETDKDCGGPNRQTCADGFGCTAGSDCDDGVCALGVTPAAGSSPSAATGGKRCKPAAYDDGVKNGNETDQDCGGDPAHKCAVGKKCSAPSDCASDGCHSTDKVCVLRRSCARTYGGNTCGATENATDDCCATIDVQRPTKAKVKLGKYKITAGRMREFITRVNGNVKGYINGLNLPATRWDAAKWTPWLPENLDDVVKRFGPNAISDESGFGTITGARGCQVSGGGGRAYWFDYPAGVGEAAIPANEVSKYSHDQDDEKMMSCLMPMVAEAFCIWDGGDLADPDDLKYAWNGTATAAGVPTQTRKWPWGDTPDIPRSRGGSDAACVANNCNNYLVHQWNYLYPDYKSPDSTAIIPAPGRRPAGAGPFGHMDLVGAGFEYTKRTGQASLNTWNAGSFEGHVPPEYGQLYSSNAELTRRYYAFSAGRCSYPSP